MQIGFVLFPDLTALDLVGPYEVLSRLPGARVRTVGGERGAVRAQHGLELGVQESFESCPQLDLLCVPGGPGQSAMMEDAGLLRFLRHQEPGAGWVAGVCTGALLLGAAGLLHGRRATTHWRYADCLRDLGAIPVRKRVVTDGKLITAAGVSAGLDAGLFLAALIAGESVAQAIQLQIEYDPQPPFQCGSPESAPPELVDAVEEQTEALHAARREQTRRIGHALRAVSG